MIIHKNHLLDKRQRRAMLALALEQVETGVELHTRAKRSCTTKLTCSRLGQSHFSDRCPMPLLAARKKKVEIRPIIIDRAPFSSSVVGGLESTGTDEWRAGKSGPGALGSLSKGPTGSTSYELLSTDHDDCCDASSVPR